MKPPRCAICHKRFGLEEGGLVYFAKRSSDIEWEERMKRTGGVGHPPYAEWFCDQHLPRAKELSNLTIDKACAIMKAELNAVSS